MLRIAVTGHRPNKLWGYDLYNPKYIALGKEIKNTILDLKQGLNVSGDVGLVNNTDCELISGMALGVDTIFALIALKLKREDNSYSLHCAIPCKNHSSKWFGESVKQYNNILNLADSVHYVTNGNYTNQCMQLRNEYMVDRCDVLIAVWDGTQGGTANCIKYAREVGKPIHFINPREI